MVHYHGYGTQSWGKSKETECHWGNVKVFTSHDGIEVWAGGSSRGGGWWKMRPLPGLAMGPDNEVKKGYSELIVKTKGTNMEGWKALENLTAKEPPAVLEMDFPDYNVPQDCKEQFWQDIVEDIREREITVVHVMCMGGHGRTGIQLACLRWFLATEEEREAWPDAHALIMAIRKPYCDKAVEADKQQAYVAQMCGIPNGPMLPFHKGGYTTYSKKTEDKGDKKLSGANIDLLECDTCDFVAFEDPDNDIEEGEFCYDYLCKGHLQDISDFSLNRIDNRDIHNYQICIYTLDVCSDVSVFRLDVLSEQLMEETHGKEWKQIMQTLMSKNAKNTIRGELLRNLWAELCNPTADNVLVAVTDALSDPLTQNGVGKPDYSKRHTVGKHSWTKCGLCKSSTPPHKLTVAFTNKKEKGVTVQQAIACCGKCIAESGMEMIDRLDGDHKTATMNNRVYQLVDGLSPQHAFTPGTMRAQNKYPVEQDDINDVDVQLSTWETDLAASEDSDEGLKMLGLGADDPSLIDDEILDELDGKYSDNHVKVDLDFEDLYDEEDWEEFGYYVDEHGVLQEIKEEEE